MFQKIIRVLGGDPHKKEIDRLSVIVQEINALEDRFEKMSDDELRGLTGRFRARLDAVEGREQKRKVLDEILPEAFAAVREASKRTLGMRPYDVQLLGGIALHQGKIAEMRTGEGKTLVATLPVYLNALLGRGVHLVTVNDYLARRDARWMAPIYNALGMTVGVLQMAARTENGRNAFLVDLEKESSQEDQHQLQMVPRAVAYQADVTYGTNSEFGFDYLRDNLTMSLSDRVQRGHYYAIIDEVDNILIDEARTPLIISGPAQDDSEWYVRMAQVVRQLRPEDYEINEKDRSVSLTELGEAHVEELLQMPLRDPDRPEDITPEQARLMGYLEQALRAQFLYRRNKDYLVQAGKVVIIDEFTGRLMPGRRWSDGLHQAVEAKEGVKVEPENVTYATITIQNYFRMYEKLAGMSGTAVTEAEEFWKIYKLDVLAIPTNLEYQASRPGSPYVTVEAKDPQGYKYTYYARRDDPGKRPVYYRRQDYPDVVYRTEEAKLRAIVQEILHFHVIGRPQLVGTTSVEHSERLSDRLGADMIRRFAQALLLRDLYLEAKKIELTERAIPELQLLNKPLDKLETAEMRSLARSLGITMSFNPEDPDNLARLLRLLDLRPEHAERLKKVLQGGVPHQVLNARKHDEESKIIAKAGAFGAVTIATNMAGRGVDIKLGGELDEDILGDTNRVLDRAGYDAYNMNNQERLAALKTMNPADWGIYEPSVNAFLQYMQEMEQVRQLGGLHVIGSERHEARRIDNQLRGRAARQGDPGSSRFYLALDDELMRLFGGQQVTGLMTRLNLDESLPIESNIVGRLVEQSQERVEGSNFDVRKHLLEYDDVLNAQRKRIYEQRDRVFVKEDLSEDVAEMLRTELQQRIPTALKDKEGPWKLVAYLDEIQPPILYEDLAYPSFSMRLLMDELIEKRPGEGASASRLREELLNLAQRAWQAEHDHLFHSFQQLLERAEETLESQKQERYDALDAFFDSLSDRTGEDGRPPSMQEIAEELTGLLRLPQFRMTPDQMRRLERDPEDLKEELRGLIDDYLLNVTISRVVGVIERRLGESLNIRSNQFQQEDVDWNEVAAFILDETERLMQRQYERLFGSGGQVANDIDPYLEKLDDYTTDEKHLLTLLGIMMEGVRMVFDRRTHRQGFQRTRRLNYAYLAGQLLQDVAPEEVSERVLEQFETAQEVLRQVWGRYEWQRLSQNNVTLSQLDERLRTRLADVLGQEVYERICDQALNTFSEEERQRVMDVLGWFDQNEAMRRLLLSVISEQWVDYLTRVEALRVSIGLEAYAQRDPLVQYKGRASEMFQELLAEVRMGVISRMFTFQPRQPTSNMAAEPQRANGGASASDDGAKGGAPSQAAPVAAVQTGQAPSGDKKKKRKRH